MYALVTGGSGLLGKELQRLRSYWLYPTRYHLDLSWRSMDISTYISGKLTKDDILIHCAALTGLDNCEKERHKARQINVQATRILAKSCCDIGCSMIYISTDYVFDGKKGNYKETDHAEPCGYYALTKWEAEAFVLEYGKNTVIRTSFCPKDYWPYPAAFTDKYSSFVTVDKIAEAIIKIAVDEYRPLGILHVGGKKKSFYDLAKKLKPDVQKISLNDIDLEIPKDTSLNCGRFNRIYEAIE